MQWLFLFVCLYFFKVGVIDLKQLPRARYSRMQHDPSARAPWCSMPAGTCTHTRLTKVQICRAARLAVGVSRLLVWLQRSSFWFLSEQQKYWSTSVQVTCGFTLLLSNQAEKNWATRVLWNLVTASFTLQICLTKLALKVFIFDLQYAVAIGVAVVWFVFILPHSFAGAKWALRLLGLLEYQSNEDHCRRRWVEQTGYFIDLWFARVSQRSVKVHNFARLYMSAVRNFWDWLFMIVFDISIVGWLYYDGAISPYEREGNILVRSSPVSWSTLVLMVCLCLDMYTYLASSSQWPYIM